MHSEPCNGTILEELVAGAAIVVKFVWRGQPRVMRRQLPGLASQWGRCRFVFDPECREYDWLAVYDDLAPLPGKRRSSGIERLSCAPEHTLFITVEPSSIKTYGYEFLDQFGVIITSQEPWAITNRQAVFTQPALRWFYGDSAENTRLYNDLANNPPLHKTANVSTVCSNKQHKRTVHGERYRFTMRLKELLPELEVFGRGVRDITDKADALDRFRCHVVVENHICPHHWTEKLADAFLGVTLPFYYGCPNAADYFPADSFIPIDIADPERTAATIRSALATRQFERRLPHILEARRLVLEEYNLFAVIAREVERHFDPQKKAVPGACIYNRHRSRRRNLLSAMRFGIEHVRIRVRNRQLARRRAA
jgi:Glycosyltransferase family 10 (fucosyltransferase) C-term